MAVRLHAQSLNLTYINLPPLHIVNGVAKHLAQRFNLVIIAKAPIDVIRAYAKKRGWNDLRFLSSYNNTFNKDIGVENPEWLKDSPQNPGMSVFQYEEGKDGEEGTLKFWYLDCTVVWMEGWTRPSRNGCSDARLEFV